MKQRSVILALLFSLFTFGLYYIYWFVSVTNATNELAPKYKTMGGFAAYVVGLLTGGFYFLYWAYRLGQKAGTIKKVNGEGGMYLVLTILTLSIVPMCMAQSALNDVLKSATTSAVKNLEE